MAPRAIMVGVPDTCRQLERQLDLLAQRPLTLGWVVPQGARGGGGAADPILGELADLEAIVARRRPDLALVTLPAAMSGLVTAVRTRLRRLGVPDRFMPTLADQVAGVGPRSRLEIDPGELLGRPPRSVDREAIAGLVGGKRVLITGAGGSIGSELARLVCGLGAGRLILVERSENALFEIDRQIARRAPDLPRQALLHDVVEREATLGHFLRLRPQLIFHAAAHKHVPMMENHPAAAVDNNFFGTRSVTDAADAAGTERFVLISTDKAVNPRSIMGATKRLAELYVQHVDRRSTTAFAVVRFGNVLGSTGSVLDIWSRQIAEGGPLTVTDPRMTRYFMTIPEAAALVVQAAALPRRRPDPSAVFMLDMGRPVRILDLARRFAALHGLRVVSPSGDPGIAARRPVSEVGTIQIVFTGARPGEKLHEELAADPASIRPTQHPDITTWSGVGRAAPELAEVEEMISALSPERRSPRPEAVARMVRRLVWTPPAPAAA